MNYLSETYKKAATLLLRMAMHLFFLLPLNQRRIMFICYSGKQCSGSPKVIYEELMQKYREHFELIWAFDDSYLLKNHPIEMKSVRYFSLQFFIYLYTSKVLVTNDTLFPFAVKRPGQLFLQTWHGGGAYKKVGTSTTGLYSPRTLKNLVRSMNLFDCCLSSCKMADEFVFREGFVYRGIMLCFGLPRNDAIIHKNESNSSVYMTLGIPDSNNIVLFAPTFRQDGRGPLPFNSDRVLHAMSLRFNGKWSLVVRTHHRIAQSLNAEKTGVYNGNLIDDTQELIEQADVLITDYSSIFWDFSLSHKPCFVYAEDLNAYVKSRDFYIGPDKWPFSISKNEDELEENILTFDQEIYEASLSEHYAYMGSYERGEATRSVIKYINHELHYVN